MHGVGFAFIQSRQPEHQIAEREIRTKATLVDYFTGHTNNSIGTATAITSSERGAPRRE
jgi:hypothetical protein